MTPKEFAFRAQQIFKECDGDAGKDGRLGHAAMDALMEDRTTFVIAHRLSTVRKANAIMVLEQGRIIERGSHDELIAKKGKYYQLYTGKTA